MRECLADQFSSCLRVQLLETSARLCRMSVSFPCLAVQRMLMYVRHSKNTQAV
jgi:hypothetical protein